MNRASAIDSIVASLTPAANEMTNLFLRKAAVSWSTERDAGLHAYEKNIRVPRDLEIASCDRDPRFLLQKRRSSSTGWLA
jgi:hypothetical protein